MAPKSNNTDWNSQEKNSLFSRGLWTCARMLLHLQSFTSLLCLHAFQLPMAPSTMLLASHWALFNAQILLDWKGMAGMDTDCHQGNAILSVKLGIRYLRPTQGPCRIQFLSLKADKMLAHLVGKISLGACLPACTDLETALLSIPYNFENSFQVVCCLCTWIMVAWSCGVFVFALVCCRIVDQDLKWIVVYPQEMIDLHRAPSDSGGVK